MLKTANNIINNTLLQNLKQSAGFIPNRAVPRNNTRNILITAALPYVNNTPHLGNIIGSLLSADAYARYCRLRGYNTFFVSGTDEYGTTTEVKAIKEGLTPSQICNKYYNEHKLIYDWFQIECDYFGRTSNPIHTQITQQIFGQLYQNGFSQIKSSHQFYCQKCQFSLADRYVIGKCGNCGADSKGDQCDSCSTIFSNTTQDLKQPKCSLCSTKPIVKETSHLYLNLIRCQNFLQNWLIKENGMKKWSNNSKGITKAWINKQLQNRCITRDLKWGVPVPQNYISGNKVFYVWFEAPIGYISMTASALGQKWRNWWTPNKETPVELNQFMGKDNTAFHSILAPATLHSTSKPYIKPERLSVTEYLLYDGGKFSKSNNRGVFGKDCQKTGIPIDVWRYYLLINRPESFDTEFTWDQLSKRNRTDLMNTIGNMCNRILKYTYSNLKNKIPPLQPHLFENVDTSFILEISSLIKKYCEHFQNAQIKASAHIILEIGQLINKYLQDTEFWSKKNVSSSRNVVVIGLSLRVLEFYALIMRPFLPQTSDSILKILSLDHTNILQFKQNLELSSQFEDILLNQSKVSQQNSKWAKLELQKPNILFSESKFLIIKVSDQKITQLKKQFAGKAQHML